MPSGMHTTRSGCTGQFVLGVIVGVLAAPGAVAQQQPTIIPPQLLADPVVTYPEDALREGVAGDVVMDIELDQTGAVQWVRVNAAPDPRLAWAALGAVTKLPFSPARHIGDDGEEHPTAVRFTYTLSFAIDEAERSRRLAAEEAAALALLGIHGHVVDPAGLPVPNARVSVEGTNAFVDTGADGVFELRDVPPGSAVLVVSAPSFATARIVVERGEGDAHEDMLVQLTPLDAEEAAPALETTVGARRPAESARRTLTQDVAVIDEKALARVRGRTLAGTLAEVPGVTMVQSGPALAKPVVRGFFGRRLVMLVDGVRHEGQDWGIDHAPEIDPQAAGRIEVVKGAAGVRYGPDAIGGVVLLEPRPLRVEPGIDGDISLVGVDNGLRGGVGGRVDVVLPELPSLTLRLEGNANKGAAVSAPEYVLGNTATEVLNAGITLAWRTQLFEQDASVKVSYRRFEEKLGICYCLNINTPEELEGAVAADRPIGAESWTTRYELDRPRQEVSHDTALVRAAVDVGDIGRLSTSYAFQLDLRDEFDQVRRSVEGPQFHFQLMTHALDVVFEHAALRFGRFALNGQAGVHGEMQEHYYEGLQLIPNFRRFAGGAFILERVVINDVGGVGDLELVAGVRVDQLFQTTFLSESAFLTQVRRERLGENDCERVDDVARCEKNVSALSVTAGARQHVDVFGRKDAFVFQVDASSASRFPDVDELYLGGRAPSFPVFGLGDAGLGTERALQLSLGAEMNVPYLLVDAGAFASRIDDYIVFGPELGTDGKPVVDVLITGAYPRFSSHAVDALLYGFDGGVVVAPGERLSLAVQAAIVRGLDLTGGGYLPFMPPPQARIELRSHLPDPGAPLPPLPLRGTTLSTGVVLVARQDRTDSGTDFVPPPDGYVLWNAGAETEVDIVGVPVRIGVEVRNLANTRYREALSLTRFFADEPGREIWLRLEARLDDDGDDDSAEGNR